MKAQGSCLCKSVQLELEVDDEFDVCHCGMCRKWNGAPAFTVDIKKEITVRGSEFIATYDSSEWAERSFCKKCGTHLSYKLKGSAFKNISLYVLENSEKFKFHQQIFIDHKPAHYEFANETGKMTEAEVLAKFGASP